MNLLARFVGGLSERLLVLTLALGAAQFPIYYTAYSNTVAGARLEAEARFRELEREATQLQTSIEEFIRRHESNPDPLFHASGRVHRSTVERYQRYTAMAFALGAAPVWRRSLALAQNFDFQLHAVTRFEPGLPLTLEGGLYALTGLLTGWLLSAAIGWPFRRRALRPGRAPATRWRA